MELFVIVAIGFATLYLLGFCNRGPSWTKTWVKTAAMVPLVFVAWFAAAPTALLAGLALGAVGDFWLSRPGKHSFLIGLIAFAAGHIAYIWLLMFVGAAFDVTWPSALLVVFAIVMAIILVPRAGALAIPVLGYVMVIGCLGVLAVGLPAGHALGLVAALTFIASDALLGVSLFVLSEKWQLNWPLSAAIWSFYFVAQLMFLIAYDGVWLV